MRDKRGLFCSTVLIAGVLLGGASMSSRTVEQPVATQGMSVPVAAADSPSEELAAREYVVPWGWHRKISMGLFEGAEGKSSAFSYRSSDPSVAEVNRKGRITGRKKGTATITICDKKNADRVWKCPVRVQGEQPGWHGSGSGKKYYVGRRGKRVLGYRTIGSHSYYFDKKTSYRVIKKWKYVKIKGVKYKLYFGKKGKRMLDVTSLLPGSTRYRLKVNLSTNLVVAYARDGKKGYTIPARAMICSGGKKGHETITGEFSRLRKAGRWHVLRYRSYGQYATRIRGPYLFHSMTYDRYGDHFSLQAGEYRKLGKSASHGCIRLQAEDARWIYEHSSRCTASLYRAPKEKPPIPRPRAKKIGRDGDGRYYDRTDPYFAD